LAAIGKANLEICPIGLLIWRKRWSTAHRNAAGKEPAFGNACVDARTSAIITPGICGPSLRGDPHVSWGGPTARKEE
jgi:hypothetical protein